MREAKYRVKSFSVCWLDIELRHKVTLQQDNDPKVVLNEATVNAAVQKLEKRG